MLCLWRFISYLLCYSLCFQASNILAIYKNTTSRRHTCHTYESSALLQFKNSFDIDSSASDACMLAILNSQPLPLSYPKTRSWTNDTDCCEWDGVTCNPLSGHVINIDLSCGQLSGYVDSHSSLFRLHHLESLNLAYNNFFPSYMSPNFGQFLHLKDLNLSYSGFVGEVPLELSHLRNLISLDLSVNMLAIPMATFETMIQSLTELKELHLSEASIHSIPRSLTNLSSLESLLLNDCGLTGKLPSKILSLPRLRVLSLGGNHRLYTGIPKLFNWSSPLEVLDLSSTNISRQLPNSLKLSSSLRTLDLSNCGFYGPIPTWVWNVTEGIDLSSNDFVGELPFPSNLTDLSSLSMFRVSDNSLNGTLPSWPFHLHSMTELSLSSNQFGGKMIDIVGNVSNSLVMIELGDNKIYGSIPESLVHHSNLRGLDLSSNFLTGAVELNMFFKLENLEFLDLSNNYLSVMTSEFNSTLFWANLYSLRLSSCNINKFPFLGTIPGLADLDLSKNNIQGEIPKWLHDIGLNEESLSLNLSHNSLTRGLENLPWKGEFSVFDISHNMLQGTLPVLPSNLGAFLASNNGLSGSIDLSICSSAYLRVLDLSNNKLVGQIPYCLGSSSTKLIVLNLRSNNLSGNMPLNFSSCDSLMNLDFSFNRLEGVVPRSLAQCSRLEVLNLGNNMLNGTFPFWLGTLSKLQVIVLRSNYFHGSIVTASFSKQLFSKLRILDLSKNRFNGTLSRKFIGNMKAIRYIDEVEEKFRQYLGEGDFTYDFSITITVKNFDLYVARILRTLTTIDVSSNMLQGDIPTSVGDLDGLRWLNLSHNNFADKIPSSIGNLKLLESLDLSCNNLSGRIPQELERLTFLEVLNVSHNQLVGPIPQSSQFNTFQNDSYLGNPGLCGFPLSKKCTKGDASQQLPPTSFSPPNIEWYTHIHLWEVMLMGYGFGWVVGVISGYFMLSARKPLWLARLVYHLEYWVLCWLKKRGKRHRIRVTRN